MKKIEGTIYLNNGRYWWKVRLPGQQKQNYIALKPKGAKFATKDRKTALKLASEIWHQHISKQKTSFWDGKLSTLIQKYNAHNEEFYLPPSKTAGEISRVLLVLAGHFPNILAEDFTPLHLKEFRNFIIESEKYDWCRKTINRHMGYIKRMFKWGVSEMLVSIHTYTALTTIEGLKKGRTTARESQKVLPAAIERIETVLPLVMPVVADMIKIQLLTGMRSGEVCKMCPGNIDRTGKIWIYIPQAIDNNSEYDHKTAYLGHKKIVAIGPKAQQILAKYLFRKKNEYCFKPIEAIKQARQRKHNKRQTPIFCGNRPGTNNKGTQKFNDCYNPKSYRRAIVRACEQAYPPPEHLRKKRLSIEEKAALKKWRKDHFWHPHQLRHNAATKIRSEYGLDAARAILGHRSLGITDDYAELDYKKAREVIEKIG